MTAVLWVGTKPAIVSEGPTGASLKQGGPEETAPHPLQSGQNRGQFPRKVLRISQSSKARIQGTEADEWYKVPRWTGRGSEVMFPIPSGDCLQFSQAGLTMDRLCPPVSGGFLIWILS